MTASGIFKWNVMLQIPWGISLLNPQCTPQSDENFKENHIPPKGLFSPICECKFRKTLRKTVARTFQTSYHFP